MNQDEKKSLAHIVERYAALNDEIKTAREEQKELVDVAWEKAGAKPKVVKQLAKEKGWGELERMAQRQLEENLDQCRAALGMLLDTPLGEAGMKNAADEADEPQHHFTNPKYKSKRKRNGKQPAEAAL